MAISLFTPTQVLRCRNHGCVIRKNLVLSTTRLQKLREEFVLVAGHWSQFLAEDMGSQPSTTETLIPTLMMVSAMALIPCLPRTVNSPPMSGVPSQPGLGDSAGPWIILKPIAT